jgi:hypothetical protein
MIAPTSTGEGTMRAKRTSRGVASGAIATMISVCAGGMIAPAFASAAPSVASGVTGTWVNSAATSGITRVVIRRTADGGITVDTSSKCGQRRLCRSGKLAATLFGADVSATTGKQFMTNQQFGAHNRVLTGRVATTRAGRRLTITWNDVSTDGSRFNAAGSRVFRRVGAATSTNVVGAAATTYPAGRQPTVPDAFLGVWNNVDPATQSLVRLEITRAGDGSLLVHQFGACSPTACDNGVAPGIVYGPSGRSATANRFLVAADYGFARTVIVGQPIAKNGTLTIVNYTEFAGGDSRANYALTERFRK